ncbi:MAG TPA: pyridoxamine 5'-phosphate oxidase family protein, partial [Pyrinomonadaceae bacterium]|nr:pyridoxamine 5'-phosphate oxidase family protein [Pyrinomonadaceae bacterium]
SLPLMEETHEVLETADTKTQEAFEQNERTTLRRHPERGAHDRAQVYEILDAGFVCHVGFVANGHPFVIPTAYARIGDELFIHGARESRMMQALGAGGDVCVTVTHLDGLVLARSAAHHSLNYRSAVVFGRASVITDARAKLAALRAFTEHIVPGRWDEARRPSREELEETTVLSLPLAEASAKVRTGPPLDKEKDYKLNIWAGEIPLLTHAVEAVADPRLPPGTQVPPSVVNYLKNSKELL